MRIQLASLACCTILLAGLNPAKANTITDYGYPPPGGASFTTSGTTSGSPAVKSAANPGGITFSYFNFDPTQYGQLYFGLKGLDMGQNGGGFLLGPLSLQGGLGTAVATWSGNFTIETLNGPGSATGVFTATLQTAGMTWIDPSGVGIGGSGAPQAVTNVGGNFSVLETFTVGGAAYNSWYSGFNTLNLSSHTDVSGDYWATSPAAVPGPVLGGGTPGLILAGGALLGWLLRKRREIEAV
jgi:hypothetical protein